MKTTIPLPNDTLYEVGTFLSLKVLKARFHGCVSEQQVLEYLCPLRSAEYSRYHLMVNLQRLHPIHLNFLEGLVELARSRRNSSKQTYVCGLTPECERLLHLLDPIETLHVCHSYQEAFASLGMERAEHHGKAGAWWLRLRNLFHKQEKMAATVLVLFAILIWSYQIVQRI